MEPAQRLALGAGAQIMSFAKGQDITPPEGAGLMVLVAGSASLSVTHDGRGAVLAALAAPLILNLARLTSDLDDPCRWRALSTSQVVFLSTQATREALACDAALAAGAYAQMATRYHDLLATAASNRLVSARRRVASYLLGLPSMQATPASARLPYDKHVLASLLGMTPENLSRILGALGAYGVTVEGSLVRLADPERLSAALDRL